MIYRVWSADGYREDGKMFNAVSPRGAALLYGQLMQGNGDWGTDEWHEVLVSFGDQDWGFRLELLQSLGEKRVKVVEGFDLVPLVERRIKGRE